MMIALGEYPAPGTLGSTLYESPREELRRRLPPVETDGPASSFGELDLETIREFLRLHRQMLERIPDRGAAHDFRPVPSARHFGRLQWLSPEDGAVLDAYFPPFEDRAASTLIAFMASTMDHVRRRLEELGFPTPSGPPAIVVGDLRHEEGGTLIYVPGPPGLSELVYRIRRLPSGEYVVVVSSERPPEPRYSELVDALRREFGWEGTMHFENAEAFIRREGRLMTTAGRRLDALDGS